MEFLQLEKRRFLEKNIDYLVFMSSLTQGITYPVYKREISDDEKKSFKEHLSQRLREFAVNYKHELKEDNKERHTNNIEILQNELNSSWHRILFCHEDKQDGWITFGRVQKLFNLYLKYHWAMDWVAEPPHCPIDSIVLRNVGLLDSWQSPHFTKQKYIQAIEKCREKALGKMTIAEWELRMFNSK